MAVEVGVRGLMKSLDSHRKQADKLGDEPGGYLLLVYAIECGLKAAVLRRSNGRGTEHLDPDLRTHDLIKLAKELRMDASMVSKISSCRSHDAETHVPHHELHQAWRYGLKLHRDHERAAVAALRELGEWCDEELRG